MMRVLIYRDGLLMKKTETKPAAAFLDPRYKELQTVISKAQAIDKLNGTVQELLDDELKPYCRVANLANGILVILVASGAVATQLRYRNRGLIKSLHKNPALSHIREIQIKVRPENPEALYERPVDKTKMRESATPLSPSTAQTLIDMAQTIDDPRLREAIEKIAKHK